MRALKARALERASEYLPVPIMDGMLRDLGLTEQERPAPARGHNRKSPRGESVPAGEPAFLGELLALMEA